MITISLSLIVIIVRMNTYIGLSHLPHEARMCFTLYGLLPSPGGRDYKPVKEPIAWTSQRLFSSRG